MIRSLSKHSRPRWLAGWHANVHWILGMQGLQMALYLVAGNRYYIKATTITTPAATKQQSPGISISIRSKFNTDIYLV